MPLLSDIIPTFTRFFTEILLTLSVLQPVTVTQKAQKRSTVSILTVVQIGRSLREQRVRRFMTQEQLAQAAGISARQLVRIERNQVEPRFSTILKLAEALGVEPSELLDSA